MLILSEADIQKITNPIELTDQIIQCMQVYAEGEFLMPDRIHMDMGKNTLLLMPAAAGTHFSTKMVSLFPDNPAQDRPVLYGTVILNDGQTGLPLALLNGAKLTAMRTAAVGSAGLRYTTPSDLSTLGLIGAGVQGFHQVLFACANRPVKTVYLFDNEYSRARQLKENLSALLPSVQIVIAQNSEELARNAEAIITATNSSSAVLPDDAQLMENKHVIAIGSYKPDMVEIPDCMYNLCDDIFIDVEFALEESGDLIHPIKKGHLNRNRIKLLSDLFNKKSGDLPSRQTTVYKSVGMALFDLFTAQYLYEKALEEGYGTQVDW